MCKLKHYTQEEEYYCYFQNAVQLAYCKKKKKKGYSWIRSIFFREISFHETQQLMTMVSDVHNVLVTPNEQIKIEHFENLLPKIT